MKKNKYLLEEIHKGLYILFLAAIFGGIPLLFLILRGIKDTFSRTARFNSYFSILSSIILMHGITGLLIGKNISFSGKIHNIDKNPTISELIHKLTITTQDGKFFSTVINIFEIITSSLWIVFNSGLFKM